MAKKLEFEARMNVDDAMRSLEGLEKKAEQSFKRIQKLSDKQNQHSQNAMDKRNEADVQKHYAEQARRRAKEADEFIKQHARDKSYRDEVANARAEKAGNIADARFSEKSARTLLGEAKQEEKYASNVTKEIEKEITAYNNLQEVIKQCKDNIADLARAEAEAASGANANIGEDSWFSAIGERIKGASQSVGSVFGQLAQGAVKAGSAIGGSLIGALKKVGSVALSAARSGLQALWNGLKKIASVAVSAARTIGGALVNGLKSIGSAALNAGKNLLGFNKKHRDFSSGLKHGFMTVVKYAFGVRSLYFLFKRLRGAITESVKTFAQYDDATASAMNRLSSAMNTMKASWGAAFAPILVMVTPILERLINLLTRAANAVAALFSALSGGKTFKVATAGADSLAKSTGKVGKEAEEAKKELAGFDELEILQDNKNDSGSGDGGGGVSYEDMEIPDWAQKIKDMIAEGQWVELADMLTAKLNDAVNSIDWEGLGRNIGYWLNAAFTFAARALTGFDWKNLASKIATMLNNIMYEVDWENLGKILVGKLYIMLTSLAGLLQTLDWAYLARSLYDVLRGAVLGIDWVSVLADLVDGFSNMFEGLANGLESINFGDFANELTKRCQRMAEEVDWDSVGQSISHFLHSAITSATTFLQNYDATAIGNNIRLFFSGVFGRIQWATLAEDVLGLFSTVIDWVSSFLPTLGFGQMAKSLSELLTNMLSLVQWGELASSISNLLHTVMQSAFQFLKNLDVSSIVKGFGTFLTNVFEGLDIITLANDFLDILNVLIVKASEMLTTVNWSEVGTNISDFIYNVITNIDIGTLASNWFDMIINIVNAASEMLKGFDGAKIGEALETLYYSVVNKLDFKGLAKAVSEFVTNFVNAGTDMLRAIDWQAVGDSLYEIFMNIVTGVDWATLAESIFTFLGEGIGAAVEVVYTFIEDAVTALFDHLRSFVTDKNGDGKITGGEIIAGILEGIWETMKDIGGWIVDHIFTPFINGLKSAFGIHSPATTMNEPGQMIGEGLLDGIAEIFKSIGTWIKEHIFDPIVQGAKDGIQAIKDVFSGVGETVGNAIDSGKEAVQNTWNNFVDFFKGKKPDVYPTEEAIEFDKVSDNLNETIDTQVKNTVDAYEAYKQLTSTITTLKGKSNLTRSEMELLLQSEQMLTDLTAEYGNELERQGIIVDSNAQSVQNAAHAVTEEANAVTTASAETQNLNATVNDSNAVYANASDSATKYGSNIDAASAKSESSASKIEDSAQTIERSMVEATASTADAVMGKWTEIENATDSFSVNMQNAISGVAEMIGAFSNNLASVLQQCVFSVQQACAEMAAAWNTDWGTPHFHMPIFSMSGVFDLRTGQTPQVVIAGWQWMARGGIVDGATLIGAGEDGKEAVIPLERHTEWIDMVAEGLIDRLSSNKFINQLADAFMSVPVPAMANGAIVPPNAFQSGFDSSYGDSLMNELKALRSELAELARQPIEVSSVMYMDRREVGRSVSEFQRSEARAKG